MTDWALILDDDKERHVAFRDRFNDLERKVVVDHVQTAQECIAAMKKRKYTFVFLDHDLLGVPYQNMDEENTGSEVARWISKNLDSISETKQIIIHSFNEYGAENMRDLIPNSKWRPAAWIEEEFKKLEI